MSRLADPVYLTLKAGFAAMLGVLLAQQARVPDLLSTGFIAVVCTSPSAWAGLRRGLEQFGGALVGGAITAVLVTVFPLRNSDPRMAPVVGASIALTTGVCVRLRWTGGYITAGFTALYLALLPFPSVGEGVRVRLLAVVLGVFAATVVNGAVSLVAARPILARRLRLARELVAGPLRKTAEACTAVTARAELARSYGVAFEVVAELRRDLEGLAREVIFLRRNHLLREALTRVETAARLEELSHLGKHIALLLEDSAQVEAGLGEALGAVAHALATGDDPRPAAVALARAAEEHPELALRAAGHRLARLLEAMADSVDR